jgi:hypothetical protein
MHQSPSSQPRANWEPGCIFRVGVLLAICVGVLLVMRLGTPEQPRQTAVRVIDDSASPGPKVIATRVVPLCVTGESERRFRHCGINVG